MQNDYFNDPEGYDIKAGILPKEQPPLPSEPCWIDGLISGEPFPQDLFFYLNCHHYFLRAHWLEYLNEKVNNFDAGVMVPCMQPQCNMVVGISQIRFLLNEAQF